MLTPVADVERTIARASGFDPVANWRSGAIDDRARTHRVVAHDIKYVFASDVVGHRWGGAAAARQEIGRIAAPVFALAAEHDEWVLPEEVAGSLPAPSVFGRELVLLAGNTHDVTHDHAVLRSATEQALAHARSMVSAAPGPVTLPSLAEVFEIFAAEERWADAAHGRLGDLPRAA